MGLRVVYFATYLTRGTLRPEDWNALKFIKALKGDPINGYARVPLPIGLRPKLQESNAHIAPKWFGLMAAELVDSEEWVRPFSFVPIPNRTATVDSEGSSRTAALAKAIAEAVEGEPPAVLDVLRWLQEWPSARSGFGSRDRDEIRGNLRLVAGKKELHLLHQHPIVLVDDVMTSGGHLLGCADFLEEKKVRVQVALVAGRTVHEAPPKCWGPLETTIPEE